LKEVIANLSTYSALFPIAVCLLKLPLVGKRFYAILAYCIFSLCTDLAFRHLHVDRDHPLLLPYILSAFTVVEYCLFSAFIYFSLQSNAFKYIIIGVSIPFIIYCIAALVLSLSTTFDSLPASIESLIIIVFCLFYFYEQINTPTLSLVYLTSTFWAMVGILFYLSGILFLFLYASSLPRNETFNHWYIDNLFNILNKVFFSIAFFINKDDSHKKPDFSNKYSYT